MKSVDALIKDDQREPLLAKDREIHRLRGEVEKLKSREKHLLSEREVAEKRSSFVDSLSTPEQSERIKRKLDRTTGKSAAIVVLTDWHVGQTVDPETVNGLNAYSVSIASKRAHNAFNKSAMMLDLSRNLAKIDTLVCAILGDIISGAIHDELLESDELSPTESTDAAIEILHDGIHFLLKECKPKVLLIPCCYGNHDRTTAKKRIATAADNSYEYQAYKHLRRLFRKETKVEFLITKSYHNWVELFGRRIRFHHGDYIKYQGGVGGITIPVNKALSAWNKSKAADVDYFGHWHTYEDHVRWSSCPALVGYDAFSLSIKADYEPPGQLFSVVNGERGKVLAEMLYVE